MKTIFSIIYAHRNRDLCRIKASLSSLRKQRLQNFEVIFVDYGSREILVNQLQEFLNSIPFVTFHPLPVQQLLWNKSKALNYGIKEANGEYIFIADVDLIFHPETTKMWVGLVNPYKFYLFTLGYLNQRVTDNLSGINSFESLNAERFGGVNGMILTSKDNLLKVNGLDEFFHFYGAEDEDLFARLENAGFNRELNEVKFYYHQWHRSFSNSEDRLLSLNPRLKNIMRINQQHFQRNRDLKVTRPIRQGEMGSFVSEERAVRLESPTLRYRIPNIYSQVEHFLREEISGLKDEVIQVTFYEDSYYNSFKHRAKKTLGIQTQPYISLKKINDLVLKEILYNFRDCNYSYYICRESNTIEFILEI